MLQEYSPKDHVAAARLCPARGHGPRADGARPARRAPGRAGGAGRAALPPAIDEMIFFNEKNYLCEGTITNIFLQLKTG